MPSFDTTSSLLLKPVSAFWESAAYLAPMLRPWLVQLVYLEVVIYVVLLALRFSRQYKTWSRALLECARRTSKSPTAWVLLVSCFWGFLSNESSVLQSLKDNGNVIDCIFLACVAPLLLIKMIMLFLQQSAMAQDRTDLVSNISPNDTSLVSSGPSTRVFLGQLPRICNTCLGRVDQLALLNSNWQDRHKNIIVLRGWAGAGKTALVSHWLAEQAEKHYSSADNVYCWSFYNQGLQGTSDSSELFLESALAWFGDQSPRDGNTWARGQRLGDLVGSSDSLLILDGVETLQCAVPPREGQVLDDGLKSLIQALAAKNAGLCIITTRHEMPDLYTYVNRTVLDYELPPLSPHYGAELLTALGVKGHQGELELASTELGGHPLSLSLLAGCLKWFHHGHISRRFSIVALTQDLTQGKHAYQVLMSYYEHLVPTPRYLAILRFVALFDRPVHISLLDILFQSREIPGLTAELCHLSTTERDATIQQLRSARLLLEPSDNPCILDSHPLVRQFFANEFARGYPVSYKDAHAVLAKHFEEQVSPEPDTLKECDVLIRAIVHSCLAGQYRHAFSDMYSRRLMRGDEQFLARKLGAFSSLLLVLSHFVHNGNWDQPVDDLLAEQKVLVLLHSAWALTVTEGYGSELAAQCYRSVVARLATEPTSYESIEAEFGLCRYYRMQGELHASAHLAGEIVCTAAAFDSRAVPSALRVRATAAFYLGHFAEVKSDTLRAIKLVEDGVRAPDGVRLDLNDPGCVCEGYLALALWFLGESEVSLSHALASLQAAQKSSDVQTIIILQLIRAMLCQFSGETLSTYSAAQELIEVCSKYGFRLWEISGRIICEWANAEVDNDWAAAASRVGTQIEAWKYCDGRLFLPYWYYLQADLFSRANAHDEEVECLENGLNSADRHHEDWWTPELLRLRSDLKFRRDWAMSAVLSDLVDALRLATTQKSLFVAIRIVGQVNKLPHMPGVERLCLDERTTVGSDEAWKCIDGLATQLTSYSRNARMSLTNVHA